ncbi:hypothetical protein ACTWP5_27470 [Streptomyces sp. 4N509B]|uniref:hypothetical protein n=1 Tax=Streptomyces sp. 4N509B TaxID=3457413 RepID=UPI003FD4AEF9
MTESTPRPADTLRAAAHRLEQLATAVEADMQTNPYWQSALAPPDLYAHGIRNGLGGAPGELAATLGPRVAIAICGWLLCEAQDAVADERDPDPHALRAARALLGTEPHGPATDTTPASPAAPGPEIGTQAGAEPVWPDYTEIGPYRHPHKGTQVWAARCDGDGRCDGVLSLDHETERWAQAALARHLSEEHGRVVDLPDPAPATDAAPTPPTAPNSEPEPHTGLRPPDHTELTQLVDQLAADGAHPEWVHGARWVLQRTYLTQPGAFDDGPTTPTP